MLAESVIEWTQEWKRQGFEEGRRKGASGLLELQLTELFGPLPDDARARLQSASMEQLHVWAIRIFDAEDLNAVFGND